MRALVLLVAMAFLVGCYHDKADVSGPKREDYLLPPDQSRYNEPDRATYRAPPKAKQEDTLLNRATGGGGGAPGRNGLGGF